MEFTGNEYAWKDVIVTLLGRPVTGIRGIEYKTKQQTEALFAAGTKARSIQKGKIEIAGTITILQSEMNALNRAAKEKGYTSATELSFDIIICYVPENGLAITTDKLIGVSLSEIGHGIKEGDLYQEHALPFIAMDIEYNVI